MAIIEAQPRNGVTKKDPRGDTKLCIHCGRNRQLKEFYTNKDWEEQLGRDIWCKSCVGKLSTKQEVQEYFWDNHREWNEKIWLQAQKKAESMLTSDKTYQNSSDARRKVLLERMTAQQVPTYMSMHYKYVDNTKNGKAVTFAEAKASGEFDPSPEEDDKQWSEFFNGYYTKRDIDYLNGYYQKLEEDFNFDNESLRDYARKVCKASLQADKAQDDYAAGRCPFSDVKDALAQFDMLSKSANFAACKRKAGDTSGLTSWSETTLKLETTGHTMQRKIEWEEDDVDRVITSFMHLAKSLGLDNI